MVLSFIVGCCFSRIGDLGDSLCDLWLDCPTLGLYIPNVHMVPSLAVPKGFATRPCLGDLCIVLKKLLLFHQMIFMCPI